MARDPAELEEAAQRRAETSDRLVSSGASKKLVVAGPGTGKTHNFKRALEASGGGLAITFIRALARDLERDLGDLADVYTFHAYCKHLAHKLGGTAGLSTKFDYYPGLRLLIAADLTRLGHPGVTADDIDRALHHLDDSGGLISAALGLGDYYDAVGHTDVVARIQRHLADHLDDIPEHALIVVDEYQDFSHLEATLIETLSQVSPVLVAGDDDQALYGFKHASPRFIRELAERADVERFDLPYCSRCTEVIVDAVNNVAKEAQARGYLEGRVPRPYLCYLPEKLEESEANPSIIHARCSVETNKAQYVGRYVTEQIGEISSADIEESDAGGYPTVLVIGPGHFVKRAHALIVEQYPHAEYRASAEFRIELLHGYRRLARDARSRLGWRILLFADPSPDSEDAVLEVLRSGGELYDALETEYRNRHLAIAAVIEHLLDDEELSTQEVELLGTELGLTPEAALTRLSGDEAEETESAPRPEGEPAIVCTTLLGAKGLSAGHVFIVGFSDGHFPADPANPTDDEICKLIVGLSRTRKRCHLVSTSFFGGKWTSHSEFLSWLGVSIEEVVINKDYWK